MRPVSNFALAAALVAGGAYLAAPAHGQLAKGASQQQSAKGKAKRGAKPQPVIIRTSSGRSMTIGVEAQPALRELGTAVDAKDQVNFAARLAAADAAAKTSDEKFYVAQLRLQHALDMADEPGQLAALEALVASGGVAEADMFGTYQNIARLAAKTGNQQRAGEARSRLVELAATNPAAMASLAAERIQEKKGGEALDLLDRAIAAQRASGQVVPESWLRNALQLAHAAKMGPKAAQFSREVLAAYPTPENWRNALLIHRESVGSDRSALLELRRLMRASKAMSDKTEYLHLAADLTEAGHRIEAKQVLDEGVRANVVPTSDPLYRELIAAINPKLASDRAELASRESSAMSAPAGTAALRVADAFAGAGDYAKAAALYRTAIGKGSIDKGLANLRLGAVLAAAGNRAEAEAAFKAVTGPHASLAGLWLHWLARAPAAGS